MFIMFIANIFQFFSMLFGGYLSDRIGRKACIALGYAGLLVWAFLYFPGLDSGSNVHILGVICMGLFFQALCYGPQAAYFSEIFPTSMRYAGASFCYQIATIVAGSIAPLVATLLLRDYGGTGPIVTYLAGTVVLSCWRWPCCRKPAMCPCTRWTAPTRTVTAPDSIGVEAS